MRMYKKYTIKTKKFEVETQFTTDLGLIDTLPISTPFTFAIYKDMLVLAYDKNGWWNPLGGHIEKNETWKEALKREAQEEAGVVINDIKHIGNIVATHVGGTLPTKYPAVSILPITMAKVEEIHNWLPRETSKRGLFDGLGAAFVLGQRTDNSQILEIFQQHISEFVSVRNKYQSENQQYSWLGSHIDKFIPFSQVYGYCYTSDKKIVLVKDYDEDYFSLPGGTPEIGETAEEAFARELLEEAQISATTTDLMGSVLVKENFAGLPKMHQQIRYLSFIEDIEDFVPGKNAMEIAERILVEVQDLPNYIPWMKYPVGIEQYKLLKAHLGKI